MTIPPTDTRRVLLALTLTVLGAGGLSACGHKQSAVTPAYRIEHAAHGSATRIVLNPLGAQRDGIQMTRATRARGSALVVVPYSAVVYAPSGAVYVFTSPSTYTYTEVAISVDHISGASAYLRTGPPAGAQVVTVGAEELYGVQSGVLAQT